MWTGVDILNIEFDQSSQTKTVEGGIQMNFSLLLHSVNWNLHHNFQYRQVSTAYHYLPKGTVTWMGTDLAHCNLFFSYDFAIVLSSFTRIADQGDWEMCVLNPTIRGIFEWSDRTHIWLVKRNIYRGVGDLSLLTAMKKLTLFMDYPLNWMI